MSVPPEILQRMTQGAAQGAPDMPPTGGDWGQAPGGSPTPQPQEKKGLKLAAQSNLSIAQNMLEQALTAFGPEDKEYKVVLKCLTSLSQITAKSDASDLVPAEVMRMVNSLPQMGGGTDIQRMLRAQMQAPQGAPGGMPPGAPGGAAQPRPA